MTGTFNAKLSGYFTSEYNTKVWREDVPMQLTFELAEENDFLLRVTDWNEIKETKG
jgi:hypothetical protein